MRAFCLSLLVFLSLVNAEESVTIRHFSFGSGKGEISKLIPLRTVPENASSFLCKQFQANSVSMLLDSAVVEGTEKTTYSYDQNGNVAYSEIYEWLNNEWVQAGSYEYTYNQDGVLIEATGSIVLDASDTETTTKNEYIYDQDGNLIQIIAYWTFDQSESEFTYSIEYIYDDQNNLVESRMYLTNHEDEESILSGISEYEYDQNGNMTREIHSDPELNITGKIDYFYDLDTQADIQIPGILPMSNHPLTHIISYTWNEYTEAFEDAITINFYYSQPSNSVIHFANNLKNGSPVSLNTIDNGSILIVNHHTQPMGATIHNLLGRVINKTELQPGKTSMNITDFPEGVYFLNVRSEAGRISTLRFVR